MIVISMVKTRRAMLLRASNVAFETSGVGSSIIFVLSERVWKARAVLDASVGDENRCNGL